MYLVVENNTWRIIHTPDQYAGIFRPNDPERNMVNKLTTRVINIDQFPIEALPAVTAICGLPNTHKSRLAVALAKMVDRSKNVLLIDPTGGTISFPGICGWSDGRITEKKLMAVLRTYVKDGFGWTVIIDSMGELELGVDPHPSELDRATESRRLCAVLKKMTQSLPVKFILLEHERTQIMPFMQPDPTPLTPVPDFSLTDLWIRTHGATKDEVTITVSTQPDVVSAPWTLRLNDIPNH